MSLFRSLLIRPLPFSSESSGKKEPKLPEQGNTTNTRMTVFTVSTHTSSRHLSTFLLDADYVPLNMILSLQLAEPATLPSTNRPPSCKSTHGSFPNRTPPLGRLTHPSSHLLDHSDSGCGWPAFFDAIPGAVGRNVDRSMFMERIEIVCNNCEWAELHWLISWFEFVTDGFGVWSLGGGHLGHVFKVSHSRRRVANKSRILGFVTDIPFRGLYRARNSATPLMSDTGKPLPTRFHSPPTTLHKLTNNSTITASTRSHSTSRQKMRPRPRNESLADGLGNGSRRWLMWRQ